MKDVDLKNNLRPIQFCKKGFYNGTGINIPSDFQNGLFHGFFTEGSSNENIETYGLIELEDGTLRTIQTHKMKFIDMVISL